MNDKFIEKSAYVYKSQWDCQYQFENVLGGFKYAVFEFNNKTLNNKFGMIESIILALEPNIWYKIKI